MRTFKKIQLILLIATAPLFGACSDFLDVSKELSQQLDMEQSFNNVGYTRNFHAYIYSGIPDVSNIIINSSYAGLTGLDNPWPTLSDELKAAQNNTKQVPSVGYHAGNASFSRWSLYKQIRQANIFITQAHTIVSVGSTTDYIDEEALAKMKNEARFLRAYYHYLLFELYGPIPIMTEAAESSAAELDYYRSSVDEVIKFVNDELDACWDLLPDDQSKLDKGSEATPTKVAALAIKAKLAVYAASPLFNGGYVEAVALRDNRDVQLFPNADPEKWKTAVKALETLINYAESHVCSRTAEGESNYGLYYATWGKTGQLVRATKDDFDPKASLYGMFQESDDNPEILWASSKNSWGDVGGEGRERRCTPRAIYNGYSNVGVVQEMVDAFFMEDGKLAVNDNGESYLPVSDIYAGRNEMELDGNKVANMYKNREPRFDLAVTYSGKRWQVNDTQIFFYKGSADDNTKGDNCYTGTLLYKGLNRELLATGSNPRSKYRPGILFRMTDFYLLLAEALNNTNPADPRIIEYVDMIRHRAGIEKLSVLNPSIKGNKDLQEEAIRHERRVELFAEGYRYFDVRRWMTAEGKDRQGGAFHGMDMNAGNAADFMNRIVFETRIFERRMYLYPIAQNEISKSKKLVQNPGW